MKKDPGEREKETGKMGILWGRTYPDVVVKRIGKPVGERRGKKREVRMKGRNWVQRERGRTREEITQEIESLKG